ncbi:MAG: hypothetical protein SGILL_007665, partial [Bacillariaceae sp.]
KEDRKRKLQKDLVEECGGKQEAKQRHKEHRQHKAAGDGAAIPYTQESQASIMDSIDRLDGAIRKYDAENE